MDFQLATPWNQLHGLIFWSPWCEVQLRPWKFFSPPDPSRWFVCTVRVWGPGTACSQVTGCWGVFIFMWLTEGTGFTLSEGTSGPHGSTQPTFFSWLQSHFPLTRSDSPPCAFIPSPLLAFEWNAPPSPALSHSLRVLKSNWFLKSIPYN